MRKSILRCGIFFCALVSLYAWSLDVFEFDSDAQRERYQQLTFELRCPMCQNQNLADSNSQISQDLRAEVARMIKEGMTDREIKQFMVERYGDFVLYRPPVQKNTLVLWWGPVVILILGALSYFVIIVRRSRITAPVEGEPDVPSDDDMGMGKATPGENEAAKVKKKNAELPANENANKTIS